jgi:hypothetical protein
MPRLRQSTLDRLQATYERHQMILADYEAGMPIRKLVQKYKLSAHRIAEIVAYRGNRQPPHKRYTIITASDQTTIAYSLERGQTEMSIDASSIAKGWAIVYDDKVIFETVRRTRRECISAFMQDPDPVNVNWSERYSHRHLWKAQQIEIHVILKQLPCRAPKFWAYHHSPDLQ